MYKKSLPSNPPSLFKGIAQHMSGKKLKQLEDSTGWHNCFFNEITSRIDEDIFKPLYVEDNGRPNFPIRILVGMLILKDGHDWTDEQLFEACSFNLLVCYALGLTNISDSIPSSTTYYKFKQSLLEYESEKGIDLFEKCFKDLTEGQIIRYQVSGKVMRLDSKLLQSNIKKTTRLQLCLAVLRKFYLSLNAQWRERLSAGDVELLEEISTKGIESYTFKLNKEEAAKSLTSCGEVIYRLLNSYEDLQSETYDLLKRLWEEQFEIVESQDENEQQIPPPPQPKDSNNIESDTLQSAHDPDAAYRNKPGSKKQIIRGFVCNITETCSLPDEKKEGEAQDKVKDIPLNLITDVQTEKATFSDDKFFIPAIENSRQLLQDQIEAVLTDGAFNSVINEQFSNFDTGEFKWFLTAIQGVEGNYDFEKVDEQTYKVTDRRDGKIQMAKRTKKGKYRIDENHAKPKYRYFEQKTITNYFRRQGIEKYPLWVYALRANTEATIHQVFCKLRGPKTKYRGRFNNHRYALGRCFWTNFKRIQLRNVKISVKALIFQFFVSSFYPVAPEKNSFLERFPE